MTLPAAAAPDPPICDAHHHLWQPDRVLPALRRAARSDYVAEHLAADLRSAPEVVSTVFVECGMAYRRTGPAAHRPVGETAWAAQQAAALPALRAIVAHVDLTLGDGVEEAIALHAEASGGLLRGIRAATAFDPHGIRPPAHTPVAPGSMATRAFRRGAEVVARHDLTLDTWVYATQIPELVDLARRLPDLRIVLDHLGSPPALGPFATTWGDPLATWDRDLAALAAHPNVMVKLSGLGMATPRDVDAEADPDVLAAAWRDPLMRVVDHFGAERCMFGSNFPLDRRACDYATLWRAHLRASRGCTAQERRLLFHDTAVRCYRIGP